MDDKKNPLFNQQWQSLTQFNLRRLHGGMARFTKATGIHDGEEKVAQACFEQNTSYNAAAGHMGHRSASRAGLHCCRWWSGREKRNIHMPIARSFNIRQCRLCWDGLRVSYLLSNTDPFPAEVRPIYWLPNWHFLSSLLFQLRDERFIIGPEKLANHQWNFQMCMLRPVS